MALFLNPEEFVEEKMKVGSTNCNQTTNTLVQTRLCSLTKLRIDKYSKIQLRFSPLIAAKELYRCKLLRINLLAYSRWCMPKTVAARGAVTCYPPSPTQRCLPTEVRINFESIGFQ